MNLNALKFSAFLILSAAFTCFAGEPADKVANPPTVPQGTGRVLNQQKGPEWLQEVTKNLPAETQDALKNFDKAQADFLAAQAELRNQIKNAQTSKDRTQLREQIRSQREEFLEATKVVREQIREALREMKAKLHDARDKQLDEVKGDKDGKRGKGR